ncbi:MAG: V-type ATP synthase subunit D [Streptosporangiaceae bacterium]
MSPARIAVPPGRAGRLWLERRLAVAHRGADLLDRKLRLLEREHDRARATAAQTATAWDHASAQARVWLLRAALLGGQRALRLAAASPAEVTIRYDITVGVRHPAAAGCVFPAAPGTDSAAVAGARRAHQAALAAASAHAVASAELQIIETEVAATRYRLRALRDRWIPLLEGALAEAKLAIEETERADAARLRLAARGPAARGRRDAPRS